MIAAEIVLKAKMRKDASVSASVVCGYGVVMVWLWCVDSID